MHGMARRARNPDRIRRIAGAPIGAADESPRGVTARALGVGGYPRIGVGARHSRLTPRRCMTVPGRRVVAMFANGRPEDRMARALFGNCAGSMARETPDAAEPPESGRELVESRAQEIARRSSEVVEHRGESAVVDARLARCVALERTRRVVARKVRIDTALENGRHRARPRNVGDRRVAVAPAAIERRLVVFAGGETEETSGAGPE